VQQLLKEKCKSVLQQNEEQNTNLMIREVNSKFKLHCQLKQYIVKQQTSRRNMR
jgi:hypothetical protein